MALKHTIVHRDGSSKVYLSPATPGQFLVFTTRGDSEIDGIGKGQKMEITNPNSLQEILIDVNFLEDIQLKDAYIFWENAVWDDNITVDVVLPAGVPDLHPTHQGNADEVDGTITYITASSTPDETWVGKYFMSPTDMSLVRFVNEMPLFGSNNLGTVLESTAAAFIDKKYHIHITYKNEKTVNPDIKVLIFAEVYRDNTL